MHLVSLKCDIVNYTVTLLHCYTVTDNKQKKRRTIKQENDVIVKKKTKTTIGVVFSVWSHYFIHLMNKRSELSKINI